MLIGADYFGSMGSYTKLSDSTAVNTGYYTDDREVVLVIAKRDYAFITENASNSAENDYFSYCCDILSLMEAFLYQ